jgi:hypothetical protein
MTKKRLIILFFLFSVLIFGVCLSGCATFEGSKNLPYEVTPERTVVFKGEYEFMIPPRGWKMIWGEEGNDFEFGFSHVEPGPFPCQTMFVYDEEPFGGSRDLETRSKEFLKRFLWNADLRFQILEKKNVQVIGGDGIEVVVEGKNAVRKDKARSKIVFGKRGDRIVGLYITQWRSLDGTYDLSAFDVFDQFVKSLKYRKKSFFETL